MTPIVKVAASVIGIPPGGKAHTGDALHVSGLDGTPFVNEPLKVSHESDTLSCCPKIGILSRANRCSADPLKILA